MQKGEIELGCTFGVEIMNGNIYVRPSPSSSEREKNRSAAAIGGRWSVRNINHTIIVAGAGGLRRRARSEWSDWTAVNGIRTLPPLKTVIEPS
jgi:hypothetical protein